MNKYLTINSLKFYSLQKSIDILRMLFASIMVIMLASCSVISPDPTLDISSIKLVVDPDANDNSATAVDLVVIYKKELLEALQKMKANDYFKASEQIQRDYPGMVKIYRWEVVPGQVIGPQPLNLCSLSLTSSCPLGGIIFASYQHPGDHRIRLGSINKVQVHLANTQFFIEPDETE